MKSKKEKNIQAFNEDIESAGRYRYTDFNRFSVYIATKRQSDELIKLLKENTKESIDILDVGCGDGTFTFEILERTNPKKIIGFDHARSAIRVANNTVSSKDREKIKFLYGDVYDAHKMFKRNSFDIIVIRGVLHHLYNPKKAIKLLSYLSNKIIVLEPNGFSPILKIIENISPYHIKREEKSYWPPALNKWFFDNGFKVKKQLIFGVVPYFCPKSIARLLRWAERFMEKIPFVKLLYCGTNLIYYEK